MKTFTAPKQFTLTTVIPLPTAKWLVQATTGGSEIYTYLVSNHGISNPIPGYAYSHSPIYPRKDYLLGHFSFTTRQGLMLDTEYTHHGFFTPDGTTTKNIKLAAKDKLCRPHPHFHTYLFNAEYKRFDHNTEGYLITLLTGAKEHAALIFNSNTRQFITLEMNFSSSPNFHASFSTNGDQLLIHDGETIAILDNPLLD